MIEDGDDGRWKEGEVYSLFKFQSFSQAHLKKVSLHLRAKNLTTTNPIRAPNWF